VFWERNFFASSFPALGQLLQNNFVRGAVSGLGVVNVVAGLMELSVLMVGSRARNVILGDSGQQVS
jgi:hypothetical protein